MKRLKNLILLLVAFVCLLSFVNCQSPGSESRAVPSFGVAPGGTGQGYFGYVGIDCGTNYIQEVASYSNLNHLCVYDAVDIRSRLQAFKTNGVKAFLDLHFLFFEEGGAPGGSGSGFELRADYQTRWDLFKNTNAEVLTSDFIGAFYVAEEPTWLGLTATDVQTVARLVKADFPQVPVALIEAHQALQDLVVPVEVDWVGMDYYGAIDPLNAPMYQPFAWINLMWQDYYAQIKARRSRPDQKLILVFDAQFAPAYEAVGYQQSSLVDFVQNYQLKMASDPDVVAMIGYVYFSGLDADTLGLRDLPTVVKDANVRVGKLVTGK